MSRFMAVDTRRYKKPLFSKRHYEKMVDVLATASRYDQTERPHDTVDLFVQRIATMFEVDNPNFDRDFFMNKFYTLARVEEGVNS